MSYILSNTDRVNIITKLLHNDYMLILTQYDSDYGQDIMLINSNRGIERKYVVRLPYIPKPPVKKGRFRIHKNGGKFDKSDGYAYKNDAGSFVISDSMKRVLKLDL